MPGEAKTSEFLLSTATLMVGPMSKVMELDPTNHSIGLVKNVQVQVNTSFTELTQGVNSTVVASVNTKTDTTISAEVYEYSAKNLAYAAGLDATLTNFAPIATTYTLNTAITTGGSSVVLGAGQGADFVAGSFVILQDTTTPDRLHVGKVLSVATDTLTLATGYTMPTTTTFAVATTKVFRVQSVQMGANPVQNYFGVKAVGVMPNTSDPITLIFPKVRITKGLNVAFQTNDFSNMPFEFTPYNLVPGDNYYADFGSLKTWQVMRR